MFDLPSFHPIDGVVSDSDLGFHPIDGVVSANDLGDISDLDEDNLDSLLDFEDAEVKMASKKRKADEISDDSDVATPHLPSPAWGHVLDYMLYGDVRSALLIGKCIAVEAVNYVQVLNVMTASEMNVPAVRRFANVEEVNILGFLQGPKNCKVGDETCTVTVSENVASRSACFLSAFPNLSSTFIGGHILVSQEGLLKKGKMTHRGVWDCWNHGNMVPANHDEIIRGLAHSICVAFKTEKLSQSVKIIGVVGKNMQVTRACFFGGVRKVCELCYDIVRYYPLTTLLSEDWPSECYCLRDFNFWKMIHDRHGGKQALRANSAKFLLRWLRRYSGTDYIRKCPLPPQIQQRRDDAEVSLIVQTMTRAETFAALDAIIALGFDPKLITKEEFHKYFSDRIGEHTRENVSKPRQYTYWLRSTVEKLAARGFPVDCDSIPVIDDEFTGSIYD